MRWGYMPTRLQAIYTRETDLLDNQRVQQVNQLIQQNLYGYRVEPSYSRPHLLPMRRTK